MQASVCEYKCLHIFFVYAMPTYYFSSWQKKKIAMTVAIALVLFYYASNSIFETLEKKPKKREKKPKKRRKNQKIINIAFCIMPNCHFLLPPLAYVKNNSYLKLLSLLLYHNNKSLICAMRNNMLKVKNKYLIFKINIIKIKPCLLINNRSETELINKFFIFANKILFLS